MQAFFLALGASRRFCLFHEPCGALRGALLHVHPFAEEMNLSRRMAALQARDLARAGYAVLQIDLFGCGDSDGEFADATWARWVDDVAAAADWLQAKTGLAADFWGVRGGCLLAVAAARALGQPARLVFWQAVVSGEAHWRQFLRIQLAGALLAEAAPTRPDPRDAVAVAGYRVAPQLLAGLIAARLDLPPTRGAVLCLELNAGGDAPTPALAQRMDDWRAAGHAVRSAVLPGPTFWQSPDVADCPALVQATTALIAAEWA